MQIVGDLIDKTKKNLMTWPLLTVGPPIGFEEFQFLWKLGTVEVTNQRDSKFQVWELTVISIGRSPSTIWAPISSAALWAARNWKPKVKSSKFILNLYALPTRQFFYKRLTLYHEMWTCSRYYRNLTSSPVATPAELEMRFDIAPNNNRNASADLPPVPCSSILIIWYWNTSHHWNTNLNTGPEIRYREIEPEHIEEVWKSAYRAQDCDWQQTRSCHRSLTSD